MDGRVQPEIEEVPWTTPSFSTSSRTRGASTPAATWRWEEWTWPTWPREFGTPLYVFCEETLRGRCRAFQDAFRSVHPDTQVVYAAKAYVGPALARLVQEEGLGMDVVSGGELAVAQSVGFPPESIYFHGNNKSQAELAQALDYGVGRIVIDNLPELDRLEALAAARGETQSILLRITPGIDPHTHAHTTTGVLDSKFGLPLATGDAAEAMRKALRSPHLRLVGPPLPPGLSHLRVGALRRRGRRGPGLCRSLP